MKRAILIIMVVASIMGILLYSAFNWEAVERRIVEGRFYETQTVKAKEVLAFSIYPKEDYAYKVLGGRKLLMEKYDSKIFLEPLIDQGESYWVSWSFDNRWDLGEGECFTFREIRYENGKKLYSSANPIFEAFDQNGNRVNGSWGGGGSTYNYGFSLDKDIFEKADRIDIKFSNFNLMKYKAKFF